MSKKTRKNSGSSIRDYLGEPGKEWLPSELPTLRNVLLYMQFIKELSKQDARTVRDRQGNIFICKCVDSALNPDYETVNGPDLVTLSPDVVKDLSHDQKYGYKIIKALTSGVLPMEIANYAMD